MTDRQAMTDRCNSDTHVPFPLLLLLLQDEAKLQLGAFYLDRSPQAKHLTLGGTHYSPQQAAQLWEQLMAMAGLPGQPGAAAAAAGAPQ